MAERDLSADMLAAIAAGNVRPAILYEGEYISGVSTAYLRLWTGVGSLSWDSKTWLGGGQLLGISVLGEAVGVKAHGFSVTLSGMPTSLVSIALQSVERNRPGRLWLMLFDTAGAVIADPYLLKRGRFNMIPIEDNGETSTITAEYEDRLFSMNHPRERHYTRESQQLRSAGDEGFSFVEQLQDASFALS